MMTITRRAPLVALLVLLILGYAWALEGSGSNESNLESCDRLKKTNTETVEVWREVIVTNIDNSLAAESDIAGTSPGESEDDTQAATPTASRPRDDADNLQLRRRTDPSAAQITPGPPLLLHARQDQAQVDALNARIQVLQQSAQQALQVVSDQSRSVSQASQQLSQESAQLSQSFARLSTSSQQLSLQLSVATQSVQSLTRALSEAVSTGSSALASCTSSAASVAASASGELRNQVGQALAQATAARVSFGCACGPCYPPWFGPLDRRIAKTPRKRNRN